MKPDESRTVYDGRYRRHVERWGENEREIVEHPGAVAIVAVDEDDDVWLVRQLREPARKQLVELPAGTREAGEDPLATAKRELARGVRPDRRRLERARRLLDDARLLPRAHGVFLAEGVRPRATDPDDDEDVEVVRWPVGELDARLDELEDAKSIAGLLLYLRARRAS